MSTIETQFVDNAIDVVNSFHRDERKAQVRQLRAEAKAKVKESIDSLRAGSAVDPFYVQDKAREHGRKFLEGRYGEETVARGLNA